MATILTVEEVKRDENRRVVWVIIKVVIEKTEEHTATFMQSGEKVKRIWYPGKDRYIPKDVYEQMARKAYAIIFDKRFNKPKPPKQLNLPLKYDESACG